MDTGGILNGWLEQFFDEVTPVEFYRGIFPAGELEQRRTHEENRDDPRTNKYCGIVIEVTGEKKADGKSRIKRYSITDDLEVIERLAQSDNFCLCSPISYAGKERTAENARFMYAIAVDLDHIQIHEGRPSGLISLWNGHIENVGRIPKPTYIVSSGTGLHLYFVLNKPVALFKDTAKQLQNLKRALTAKIWHGTIVDIRNEKEIQQEGIYQGFRVPGTITKQGGRTRAFWTGEPVTIDYLNGFVDKKSRVERYTIKKQLTKAKAKELYPEWYKRRVENGEPVGVWHTSRNVYDWWKKQITEKAEVGHRYWCMMTLSIYAYKCSMYDPKHNPNPVTWEELKKDCFEIMEHFEELTTEDTNHFNEADVLDALEAFDNKWIKYPRDTIEYRCGFQIPHNKRNGQKQAYHLEEARAIRDIRQKRQGKKWTDGNGRKTKQIDVAIWQANNPDGTKIECHRETGLSRVTIDKYWNGGKGNGSGTNDAENGG